MFVIPKKFGHHEKGLPTLNPSHPKKFGHHEKTAALCLIESHHEQDKDENKRNRP
jgi:hypothetical protein